MVEDGWSTGSVDRCPQFAHEAVRDLVPEDVGQQLVPSALLLLVACDGKCQRRGRRDRERPFGDIEDHAAVSRDERQDLVVECHEGRVVLLTEGSSRLPFAVAGLGHPNGVEDVKGRNGSVVPVDDVDRGG